MATTLSSKALVVILTIAAFALVASTLAAVTVQQDVTSSGTITTSPNVGVYSNAACTNAITSLNWGSIAAGGTSTQTIYVKNTGTGSMTLNMTVTGWTPSNAGTYITISWNREGSALTAGQSTAATLTLTVSPSITGITSFSNTITISGTG